MPNKMKHFIQRILPSSKSQVNDQFDVLNQRINNTLFSELDKVESRITILSEQLNSLTKEVSGLKNEIIKAQESSVKSFEKGQENTVTALNTVNEKHFTILRNEIIQTKRSSKEAVWGEIFRDAIKNSKWLMQQGFYPGRWAVGYQFLYVLFRVLNSTTPKSILELGLGQSTNLIAQYVNYNKDTLHSVIEHDSNWIEYYKKEFTVPKQTQIINLDIEKINYKNKYELFHYVGFKENVCNRKYDLISIDAPFGSPDNIYSRIDILSIIPECLDNSFVIMIDDANRIGENNTIEAIKDTLSQSHISFTSGKYVGDKDTYVITSEDYKFICTL